MCHGISDTVNRCCYRWMRRIWNETAIRMKNQVNNVTEVILMRRILPIRPYERNLFNAESARLVICPVVSSDRMTSRNGARNTFGSIKRKSSMLINSVFNSKNCFTSPSCSSSCQKKSNVFNWRNTEYVHEMNYESDHSKLQNYSHFCGVMSFKFGHLSMISIIYLVTRAIPSSATFEGRHQRWNFTSQDENSIAWQGHGSILFITNCLAK